MNPNELVENNSIRVISGKDFCKIFGAEWLDVPTSAKEIFEKANFSYRIPEIKERDEILIKILKRIDANDFWVSGEDKQEIWESGWKENLQEYEETGLLSKLWPKFLNNKGVLRLNSDYIIPEDPYFEYNIIDVYRRYVFSKFLYNCDNIYEFGCGSCQHIPIFTEMFPKAVIHGLDWAESSFQIINHLKQRMGWQLEGHVFNLYEPDYTIPLKSVGGVVTVGTLEQLGSKFKPFLDYLLKSRPSIVVHLETIDEYYDDSNLPDYIANRYDRKRNYLIGYLNYIRELASAGKVEIIREQRVKFGSMFHDSYSLIAWRPI
jgi:hypothetical protein